MARICDKPVFFLDANACNALQQIAELNELEEMARIGLIELQYTETTWDESRYGSAARDGKVAEFIFCGLAGVNELEVPWRETIGMIVFPEGVKNENQKRDVDALVTVKLAGGVFVTRDGGSTTQPGGILGHKAELASLGVEVLNFTEAVQRAQTYA